MAKKYDTVVEITEIVYRNHSYYGNPSYYVGFREVKEPGCYYYGHTATNALAGYAIQGHKPGDRVKIRMHTTPKTRTPVIDYIWEL